MSLMDYFWAGFMLTSGATSCLAFQKMAVPLLSLAVDLLKTMYKNVK